MLISSIYMQNKSIDKMEVCILSHGQENLLPMVEITWETYKYYLEMVEYPTIEVERVVLIEEAPCLIGFDHGYPKQLKGMNMF
jgi:hypothetical protein